ncbi:MAG: 3-phosphoshikimate 1-carboxyvinyltransferase [Nitrososphaerota archaeon]
MVRVYVEPSRFSGFVEAVPSKSYTHRVYSTSLLVNGRSVALNPLFSSDTEATLNACRMFGAETILSKGKVELSCRRLKLPDDVVNAQNSGTTLRFFTALSSLAPPGYVVLTGDESLRKRPMQPLIDALRMLGVECWSTRGNGLAPIVVKSGGLRGGEVEIRGDVSSQFISALLISSVKAEKDVDIIVREEQVSKQYIDATIKVLENFGFKIYREGYSYYHVRGGQEGRPSVFRVPGDFSSASFLIAGAYLTGGEVEISNLDTTLPQSDSKIIDIAKDFGCRVEFRSGDTIYVKCSGIGEGGEYVLTDSPDLLPVVAVMAVKTVGETIIRGVEHAKFKESDRINSTAIELKKLGVDVEVLKDGLKIKGREEVEGGVELSSHSDHRLFMAFTVLASATKKGCIVDGLEWVKVSYPEFINHLKKLNVSIREI